MVFFQRILIYTYHMYFVKDTPHHATSAPLVEEGEGRRGPFSAFPFVLRRLRLPATRRQRQLQFLPQTTLLLRLHTCICLLFMNSRKKSLKPAGERTNERRLLALLYPPHPCTYSSSSLLMCGGCTVDNQQQRGLPSFRQYARHPPWCCTCIFR